MYDRIFTVTHKENLFIFGPRGTGKTSWLRNNYHKDVPYFDLLEDDLRFELGQSAKNLEKRIGRNYHGPVIIDEIQKFPPLLDEIHRLINLRPDLQFILTGSSARKLKKEGVNLLAGRAFIEMFFPLTIEELGDDFQLEKALQFGLLPRVWGKGNEKSFLKAYVQTYIDLEVKLEGLVKDLIGFNRFLQAATFSQGQVLNISAVAADCGIERRTITNYFSLLEDLLVSYQLTVFNKKAKRELIKHRKFYFFDTGVFNVLRPKGPLDSDREILGVSFETLILQNIMALNNYRKWDYQIFFWRTKNHLEVDFILYGQRGFWAIETKMSSRLRRDDFHGLNEFQKDYPQAECFLVYGGEKSYTHDNISILTLGDFLDKLGQF